MSAQQFPADDRLTLQQKRNAETASLAELLAWISPRRRLAGQHAAIIVRASTITGVAFRPGDRVHFAGLGTGTVMEARGQDRYAIEIKGRVVIALARDLELADARRGSRVAAGNDADMPPVTPGAAPSLDLHGKTVSEAIELVEAFISDALIDGHANVRLIHGHGSGKVKDAVHRYLRQLTTVAHFRLDPQNSGVTIATFV